LIGASQSPSRIAMRMVQCLLAATALLAPAAVCAAPARPLPSEVRLSEAEKEKILEAAAASARGPVLPLAVADLDDDALPPQIHGEVGFTVGTGGYRSAYGTAIVPLKNNGVAIISMGSTDFGSRARYLDPWWQ
jgi:hypothetical protein